MRLKMIGFSLLWLCIVITHRAWADEAKQLFSEYQSALVQIQSINIESGQKSSIGTGFFINNTEASVDNHLADKHLVANRLVTNYHVVSDVLQNPSLYRLELIDSEDVSHPVQTENFDVVNDLAILSTPVIPKRTFMLAQTPPTKGTELFSLGNPHDLGMIVVPGTYNGLKQKSFYQRIHFTGSINSGMSGGPTINEAGEVVGINVASAGNQLGFLVPVSHLHQMLAEPRVDHSTKESVIQRMTEQLMASQQAKYNEILAAPWPQQTLGQAMVPKKIAEFMPCWGGSNQDQEKTRFIQATIRCRLKDNIYLSSDMTTGFLALTFQWIHSDQLNGLQLSQLLTQRFSLSSRNYNASDDDVSNYHCAQNTVSVHQQPQKVVTCLRAYRKYLGLYDVRHSSILLGKSDQALIAQYSLEGVTQTVANQFFQQFVESVKWQ